MQQKLQLDWPPQQQEEFLLWLVVFAFLLVLHKLPMVCLLLPVIYLLLVVFELLLIVEGHALLRF